ncbi:MAG: anaerobic ribonucleoside-triphosphate reductase activating protein [Paramuribaculum sp.]|nr:anaerobic ribonucleoside-triphosphate reductase activating protein [Paramuribaculum sp.]MDE6459960.1 anaerobic ribonucleoside-triphosphate reductase activating protein [Paramuribaculum sp.]
MSLRILDIIEGTTVDGPGFRTAIYFAGCHHHCPGCHNPESWDFNAGRDIDIDTLMHLIISNDMDVSLSGGDPVYQINEIIPLCKKIRNIGKTIWLYTGFTFEELWKLDRGKELLENIDVVVEGPFIESLRNTELLFRGSSNQRLIISSGSTPDNIKLWESDF